MHILIGIKMRQEVKVIRDPEIIEIALEETRRKILSLLSVSNMTVSQLVDILEKDQSTVYRHIEKLLAAELIYVAGERKKSHIPEKVYARTAGVFILSPDLEEKKDSHVHLQFRKQQVENLGKIFYGMGILKGYNEEVGENLLRFIERSEIQIAPLLEKIPSDVSLSPQGAWRLKTILILYAIMHDRNFHEEAMKFFDQNFV
ncbi:MAG: transcriptional regulator [Thermoplasmata archaeon]|nr:transcriptional regulator [Thermoplasmata archaeon]